MKAAFYTRQGPAKEVLKIGEMEDILPAEGEIQIEIHYSGINPGEVKKRSDAFGIGMPYPKVIPHSDGAGFVRKVGANVPEAWIGKKVLCFGAQSYRPFGTAASFCCVPIQNVVELGKRTPLEQAAQMGIPGITAHRAVHIAGNPAGKVVLIQGGNGAVGQCAIQLAKRAGATVLASVRKASEIEIVKGQGVKGVFLSNDQLATKILQRFPGGIDHIVEVAFAANIEKNVAILKNEGSIATYATNQNPAEIPFWLMVFSNLSVYFLGSDDFPEEAKSRAARELALTLEEGWKGLPIGKIYNLEEIADAHLHLETRKAGRALLKVKPND